MIFTKIAFLNMGKHIKRTIVVLSAVMISVFAMEFVAGLLEGMRKDFFTNMLGDQGHVQLHGTGWSDRIDSYSIDYTIGGYEAICMELEKMPAVDFAEPVIYFGAMIINGEKNSTIAGHGVYPDTRFYTRISENIMEGTFLPGGNGVCVSTETARLMDLGLGSEIILLVEDSADSPYYLSFPVTGIYESSSRDFNGSNIVISHTAARDLLYLKDETIEIRVRLRDREESAPFLESITPIVQRNGMEGETWQQANGSFLVLFEAFDIFMIMMNVMVIVISSTVITNALLMNVFERTREYGTMRAIGLKRRQHFFLILLEGGVQGLAGSIFGVALAFPLLLYLQKNGFNWGQWSDAFGLGNTIQVTLSLKNSALNFVSGIIISVTASLYAARVSSRKSVLESLLYV